MRGLKYALVYLLLIQFFLGSFIPLDMVYANRFDYDLLKDNLNHIDTILSKLQKELAKNEREYIIILGDSVAFSGPGDSENSLGVHLARKFEENGQDLDIYNLSMPAMQLGDVYTMLLKLDRAGIETENLIFNLTYAGFVERMPDPPCVFWLQEDLKKLDLESYGEVSLNLMKNTYGESKKTWIKTLQAGIEEGILPHLSIFKYKDFLKKEVKAWFKGPQDDSLGDARMWEEKEGLRELLETDEYQKPFSDKEFVMDEKNPQIFFLEKILAWQEGKNNLVFLAGTNETLMAEEVFREGYQRNLDLIDEYFSKKDISYLNLQSEIADELFSDHVHLTSEGYQKMAEIIFKNYEV